MDSNNGVLIIDPATRLSGKEGEKFTTALMERYGRQHEALAIKFILLQHNDFAARYAMACDAACQLLWPEAYGTNPDDPLTHTSDAARAVTRIMFAAVGLANSNPGKSVSPLHPQTVTFTSAELSALSSALRSVKDGASALDVFTETPEFAAALRKIEAAHIALSSESDDK